MSYNNPGEVLTDIADSIRTLNASTSSIPFVDMPELIKGAISEPIDLSNYNGTNWILAFINHLDFNNTIMTSLFNDVDYDTTTPAYSLNLENIEVCRNCLHTFFRARLADVKLTNWVFIPNTQYGPITFDGMFMICDIHSLDLTGWDTSEISNMHEMFRSAKIAKIWIPSTFVATAVSTDSNKPFYEAPDTQIHVYTDATDAETQGWGTINPKFTIHYNSTHQDFLNAISQ